MNFTPKQRELLLSAIELFGDDLQLRKLQTECNELAAEIGKYFEGRATRDDIRSELADVFITSEQASIYLETDLVDVWVERKLDKLDCYVAARRST